MTNNNKIEYIKVRGAREHNLKNINVDVPINNLVVITGVSGSGKSTLAFDTLYAEGQRRYVESLSAYARQFLGIMNKPDVDSIKGLSPAISIEQKATSKNPRSTVGTVTEIYDYLRLLFARIGEPHCPQCGDKITFHTPDTIAEEVLKEKQDSKVLILSSIIRAQKGTYEQLFKNIKKQGYSRARVNGEILSLDKLPKLDKNKKHYVEIVIDELKIGDDKSRLYQSLESAAELTSNYLVMVNINGKDKMFSLKNACLKCGINFEEIQPRMFSFNSPFGACPECTGLGGINEFAPDLVIPDMNLSINEGAIVPWKKNLAGYYGQMVESVALEYGFSLDLPVKKLSKQALEILLYGSDKEIKYKVSNKKGSTYTWSNYFEGIIPQLERLYKQTQSEDRRTDMKKYMRTKPCPVCQGKKLRPESLAVTISGLNIIETTDLNIIDTEEFLKTLKLTDKEKIIAEPILVEVFKRLKFLNNVGLEYLTLSRSAVSLSGGEAQRIRLATQLGSELRGVLYILDEPSIGLHPRDNQKLIDTLKYLRDLGNTVIVVEHDEEMIRQADHVIDIGPGAGVHGGKVVGSGTVTEILKSKNSFTADYLSGKKHIPVPKKRRTSREFLELWGAKEHNLKISDLKIPLRIFCAVTGVSGSGKSTLVNDILYKELAKRLYKSKELPGKHEKLDNIGHLDKVIVIDQSPIGRTPRSNPATYTKVFTDIRDLFSKTNLARVKGYKPGRFSFNVRGGRCEHCRGEGMIKVEMHFLPDVYVPCEKCKGKRYNKETLEVKYHEKNISEVLDMTVEEALKFFDSISVIKDKLEVLNQVGLGYIRLGQSATTLSGGEAQRIKLASELSKRATGKTLYILDEPTTGLHLEDINKLLKVLNQLVDKGNSVIIIEHNLDVIKSADYIIDLGPEGGEAGGKVVAKGSPEEIVKVKESYTGKFLKKYLK